MAGDIAAGAARAPALPLAVLLSTPLLIAAFALSPTFGLPTAAALPLLAAGLGLQLAGAVLASAQLPVPRAGSALLRGVIGAGLLLLIGLAIGLPLLQWPFAALRASGALGPVLLFCGGVAVAGLLASRVFTDPVLLFVPEPPTRRSLGQHLARARLHSQRLFNRSQVSLGQSSAGGLLVLVLLLPPLLALDAVDVAKAGPWTWAIALHLLLLAPLAALGLARLVQTIAVEAAQASAALLSDPGSSALAEARVLPSELPVELAELAGLIQATPVEALFAAARAGDIERALALLQGFESTPAEPEPPPGRDQRGLAVLATLLADLRLLRALILRGADLNHVRAGLTPLLAATRDSYHGRPDAVAMLLANGADPRCVDADGRCPLHYAARSADPEVAAQLLDAGAEINALDRSGRSPLGEACAAGSWRLARFLLERGARCEPDGGQPALLAAAAGDDDPVGVELLLRHKAKVDASGRLGRSALMEACLAGNAAIVSVLVKAGADVNRADQQGVTALMEAARAGAVAAIDALRRKSPQVDAIDAHGRSALSIACGSAKADADTVTRLLQLGASVELRCASGQTALEQARSAQRWDLVARIDPDHPLPAAVDDSPHSTGATGPAEDDAAATAEANARERLQRALRRGRADLLPALLRALQPSPGLLYELFDELAASQPRAALSRLAAALPASGEHSRESLLASAVARAAVAPEALDALLDLGTAVVGGGSLARYLQACLDARLPAGPDERRALRLLESGADALGRHQGEAPLLLALQLGWPRLVARLLELGADPNTATTAGLGALQIATEHADLVALRLLISAGARPERRSPDGQTALGCALSLGDSALLRWLDWPRWPHPGRALCDLDLIAASVAGDAVAADCLLELGLGRRARDARGCSALLRAAGAGHVDVVAVLLKAGLDPAVAADSGMTALTAAISQGHAAVVELLLAGGSHVEQSLPGALRPLMLAAALGKVDAVRLLLGAAAERGGVDADGNTVLHHAARYGFRANEPSRAMALWSALSPSAAELAQVNGMGETPLLLLLGAAEAAGTPVQVDALMPQLERLLEIGTALDSQDQRGFSALHWAAQHGLLPAVQRLLRAGADPQRRDSLARSPREVALTRGYIDIASELEGPRPAPSMARFLRSRVD